MCGYAVGDVLFLEQAGDRREFRDEDGVQLYPRIPGKGFQCGAKFGRKCEAAARGFEYVQIVASLVGRRSAVRFERPDFRGETHLRLGRGEPMNNLVYAVDRTRVGASNQYVNETHRLSPFR